ncbi:MAG: serine/threonine protein kinase [Planctomycetes bacterium]|nr:serine/threonine protein kinase [Planctomycetota bacterium]MCC7169667.1 serine/threonine protein kinase [Planctomycetota bacterium]
MLSPDEVRFLAVLVQRGHLGKSEAEQALAACSHGGTGETVEQLMTRLGLMSAEQVRFLRTTGGEDVPVVPGFTYLSKAGVGGTSVVMRAREDKTGREVAIKVMHAALHQDPEQRRRFVREAKLLVKLQHENIVGGHRVGSVKDRSGAERLVFIMDWVPGDSLLALLRSGMQFHEDAALFIILQAARALESMHAQGILHRDVKPDNILLTRDNGVKLIDLGFATSIHEAHDVGSDTTLGTAAYMSPEQAQGTADLDERSDIYALGATLYQIVVGELPFTGEGTQEQLAARILETLSSPELQSRRISPHMNYFIRKMMEQDRAFRYQTTAELIADIEEQIRGKKTLSFREGGSDTTLDMPFQSPPDAPQNPRFPVVRKRPR